MAALFSSTIWTAIRSGDYQLYNFIDLEISTPLYLTDYHFDITANSKAYISSVLDKVAIPPKTGNITQEVQSISLSEGLSGYSSSDIITALGSDYHGATVRSRLYLADSAGTLYTDAADTVYYSEGIIKSRSRTSSEVIIEFSNAYGKLDTLRELRTTRGSMARQSNTDTSFNNADVVDDNITLEWGS